MTKTTTEDRLCLGLFRMSFRFTYVLCKEFIYQFQPKPPLKIQKQQHDCKFTDMIENPVSLFAYGPFF